MRLAPLDVQEDLAEVPLRVGPRSRPVDVPARQEKRLAQAIHQAFLLAPEPADPVVAQAEPAHHAINPFGRGPVAVKPVLLLDVKRVLERDVTVLQQPDVEIDVMLDRPEPMVADQQERGV